MANKEGHRRFGSLRKLPSGRYQARYPGPDGEAETLEPGEDSNRQVAVDALDLTAVSSLAKPSVASSAVRLSGGAMRSTLP